MPAKIEFHVIYASSEDSLFPACELNAHGPAVRGWRSSRSSKEPHELLLRLTARTHITKIQLLAHHCFISKTVELLVYDPAPEESGVQTPCGALYMTVGHLELSAPSAESIRSASDGRGTPLRELKTVSLPTRVPARFLKLKLSAPHPLPNFQQDKQQVALMAINVLGFEMSESVDVQRSQKELSEHSPYDDLTFVMYMDLQVADVVRKLDQKKKSAIADERFEYARKLKSGITSLIEAGQRMGRWALRKRLCVLEEDYEGARLYRDRLALSSRSLLQHTFLLQLLEQNGVDPQNDLLSSEDLNFAALLKMGSNPSNVVWPESISLSVHPKETKFEEVPSGATANSVCDDDPAMSEDSLQEKPNLLATRVLREMTPPIPVKTTEQHVDFVCSTVNGSGSYANSPHNSASPTNIAKRSGSSPISGRGRKVWSPQNGVQVRMRAKSGSPIRRANRNSYEAYEERAVPALRHSNTNEYLRECQLVDADNLKPHSKLNEKEKKQAALPLLIFGEGLVEKFYSKNYADKEEGLHRLRVELLSYETKKSAAITPTAHRYSGSKTMTACLSPNKIGRAAIFLIHRALRDKVFSVYNLATELIKIFFTEFVPERICPAEIIRCVDRVLPELMLKAGDPAPRINSLATHTILTVADCSHVRSLYIIPQYLTRSMSGNSNPRMVGSRLEIIEQLVLSQGLGKDKQSGLTARKVAEMSACALTHASSSVRCVAERLLVKCYEKAPRVVRSQLPPDDNVSRRNYLYRGLFQHFDRIDAQKIYSNMEESSGNLQMCNGKATTPHMTSSLSASLMANSMTHSATNPMFSSVSFANTKNTKKYNRSSLYGRQKESNDSIGYNKLRLDSAASPKHRPRFAENGCTNGWQDDSNANVIAEQNQTHNEVAGDEDRHIIKVKSTQSLCNYEDEHSPRNGNGRSPDWQLVKSKSGSNICQPSKNPRPGYFDSFDESQLEGNEGKQSIDNSAPSTRSETSTPEYDITLEGVICTFCNMAVCGSLDEHYWKQCPLLARCHSCKNVVEARLYNHHLKDECGDRNFHITCSKCLQAVHHSKYEEHLSGKNCVVVPENHSRCPHCRQNIPQDEECWRRHLMTGYETHNIAVFNVVVCPTNPRTVASSDNN